MFLWFQWWRLKHLCPHCCHFIFSSCESWPPQKSAWLWVHNLVWTSVVHITGSVHLLVVQSGLTVRFMSSFTVKFIHCVSSTVISGCVFRSHIVHLQIQSALSIVSGDCESTLYRWCIVCVTAIIVNNCNPLQGLSMSLPNPVHCEATESKSWGYTR